MTQDTTILTPSEVAERLRVSVATINGWALNGRLKAITLPSGRKRFRVVDIEAIEAGDDLEQKIAAAAEAKDRLDRALR